jgi:hypothetical protein
VRTTLHRAVLALAVTTSLMSLTGPSQAAGGAGLCAGTTNCRVVSHRDVNGDGQSDAVARILRPRQSVTLRVQVAGGPRVHRRINTERWGTNEPWQGAAKIDGKPGADLVVGFLSGAHTLFFRVLRFRDGRLQMVDAPGRARWVIDGSFSFNIGQFRSIRNGRVFMTKRTAVRDLDGTGHHGRDTRFRWNRLRWVKVSSVRRTYARDRAAFRVGGWHVRGLPRFLP